MHNELRQSPRQPLYGMAALISDGQSLVGHLADISPIGLGLNVTHAGMRDGNLRKTWLCRIVSPNLPRTVEFVVKVVRTQNRANGYGVGCSIAAIDDADARILKAYQARSTSTSPSPTTLQ